MSVWVDKSWSDDQAGHIDNSGGGASPGIADKDDFVPTYSDIGQDRIRPGAVDNPAALDEYVERLLFRRPVSHEEGPAQMGRHNGPGYYDQAYGKAYPHWIIVADLER